MKNIFKSSKHNKVSSIIRLSLFILLTVFLFNLTACSNSSEDTAKQAEKYELSLAHFFPATHPVETELLQPWTNAIEEATEGRVKINIYPAQTLLQADAIYDGVVHNIADIGLSCFSYTRGRFPVSEVFELPGINYSSSEASSLVAWEGIQKINPAEIQDTKLLMLFTTGPGDLYTKVPVRNLEDLKGMEIRATGLSAKTLSSLGATPIAMTQADAYEAMSKGVVKGNLGPIEVLKGWNQADVTNYLTQTPFLYNNVFFITMNKNVWDSMDQDLQNTISAINQEYFENVAIKLWDKQNEAALKWIVEEKGMEIIELSTDEEERWNSLLKPIQGDFIKQMNDLGLNGQEILDTVLNLNEKYNDHN